MSPVPAVRLLAALVATLPLAVACDSEKALGILERPPTITAQFDEVWVGTAMMPLAVTNASLKNWEYGACAYLVDRRAGDGWQVVSEPMICSGVGHSVAPGESFTSQVPLPAQPGTYRIRFRFLYFPNNRAQEVFSVSNTFKILARIGASAEAAPSPARR